MKKFLYETHLHTSPVSRCARASVRESLEYYKSIGYDGVFITNHFIDGNVGCDMSLSYKEKIEYYCSAYEEGIVIGNEIGLKVFFGIESSYMGADFLIYGLDKSWYLSHPEIMTMKKSESLALMAADGALVIQAHPFRDHPSVDRISLFPKYVDGAEAYNSARSDFENMMSHHFTRSYNLIYFAGSDNHTASSRKRLGGMMSDSPLIDERDFVLRVKGGQVYPFSLTLGEDGKREIKKLI